MIQHNHPIKSITINQVLHLKYWEPVVVVYFIRIMRLLLEIYYLRYILIMKQRTYILEIKTKYQPPSHPML